ncbi:hypothetical protein [Thiomicrospira microaerophila]|uniref:hypothetical protein n=1 Tax=Thiomicrospira microaerophila TaxID=406020 RepID=UPI0005C8DAC2|nr:hypothetical protein [Thiomicrospira microaerophila]
MYNAKPSVVYGFHGIDEAAGLEILNQKAEFYHSNNGYDWLGEGVYFWENNLERAWQYAREDSQREKTKIQNPFVLGAVLELGNCLDLLDQKYIDLLTVAFEQLKKDLEEEGKPLPKNESFSTGDLDFKKRKLDYAVVRYACALAENEGEPFDSVRAAFIEGDPVYEGAKFFTGNHIQIAVINPDCIKGIFLPREAGQKPTYAPPK